jgi:hypothetical protein
MTASAESRVAAGMAEGTASLQGGAPDSIRGRAPDFFIVGHPKCGTTALYEMLRRHPQIYMPDLKEPAFFASDQRARFQRPSSGPLPETLADYLSLFVAAGARQRVGEASSSYLVSRTAAERIGQLVPSARMIAILREPASFLRSLHLQLLQNHIETQRDLGKALALEDERRRGRRIPRRSSRPQALLYSERVRYVEQLRRYRDRFAPERVLVLIYDDFRRDNEGTVRRVLRFLDVDDTAPIDATEANPTVRMRSQQLDELVHAVSVGRGPLSRAVKVPVKALTPERLRRAGLRTVRRRVVFGAPPAPDAGLMLELRRRFKPEVVALSEYLDRDLVGLWGYDRIG